MGPLRVLWLAALLFAFFYTHAAGADSASAHVTGGAIAVPRLASTDAGHHHDSRTPDGRGDDQGHPAEACASGHPQQGCELPALHLVPLGEQTPALAAITPQPWNRTWPSGLPTLPSFLSSVVQQV
ncbi:hypothetical protein QEZ40_000329 [Streptomyces katrae]|uniref:Chaplin domain-containing protein n=1 Tax=Streptomyces katrae TaxID=68223 RepID=A0ABT7GLI9_9ACTN|nr:hypothetical protein [Streptomyces katrae]MDK9494455.1 hypothetical protein [Streptomyces katrae]